jgi:hypothetical protein
MMPEETYERIIHRLMEVIHDDTPILDRLTALIEILRENGITGQPLKTLQMARHLVEEVEKRKRGA